MIHTTNIPRHRELQELDASSLGQIMGGMHRVWLRVFLNGTPAAPPYPCDPLDKERERRWAEVKAQAPAIQRAALERSTREILADHALIRESMDSSLRRLAPGPQLRPALTPR